MSFKKINLITILSLLFISSINAQDRLEPFNESVFNGIDGRFRYFSEIRNVLFDKVHEEYEPFARYIVCPSFHPEYTLSFDIDYKTYYLTYVTVKKHTIWSTINHPEERGETYLIKKEIDSTDSKLIIALINVSIRNCRKPKKEHAGFDGTNYYFSNNEKTATIWSPRRETHTRKLIDIMEEIIELVKNDNINKIKFSDDLTERIKKLLVK